MMERDSERRSSADVDGVGTAEQEDVGPLLKLVEEGSEDSSSAGSSGGCETNLVERVSEKGKGIEWWQWLEDVVNTNIDERSCFEEAACDDPEKCSMEVELCHLLVHVPYTQRGVLNG
ncbi:hypothetical protein QQ045_023042 [Rhodiola kirilowii]